MDIIPPFDTPTIIAMKGFPRTIKTNIALAIARWAKCPLLCIDDFLEGLHPPSSEDEDQIGRLYHHAFDSLCNVAARQLARPDDGSRNLFNCIVIKSRLCSTFELDRLMQLAQGGNQYTYPILIIECQVANEHRWREGIASVTQLRSHWYRPKNWDEAERFRCNYDAQRWDDHFLQSINTIPGDYVRRLVLDPLNDPLFVSDGRLYNVFANAIVFLTSRDKSRLQLSTTVGFLELRQFLMEAKLKGPRLNNNLYFCNKEEGCYIKYATEDCKDSCCRACEKNIDPKSRYACHECSLSLHKSCAELINTNLHASYSDSTARQYIFPKTYACKLCADDEKDFSYGCDSCVFETHLKCRLMPTIVYHDAHPKHFLSIVLTPPTNHQLYYCWGCGMWGTYSRYVCRICSITYHLRCTALPKEVKHRHGGYEHAMELRYSIDGMEEQEDFWCDVCSKDMDPQLWFYSCKECPYFAHLDPLDGQPCGSSDPSSSGYERTLY